MQSQRKRSLLKTLTWRILATSDTFLISYLITGRFDFAGAIAGIEVITKMFASMKNLIAIKQSQNRN